MGAALGFGMRLLDLGGGFVSRQARGQPPSLGGVPAAVNAALDALFPPGCGVRIIAEPGRRAARLPTCFVCLACAHGVYV
jgi:ornithine decarboxylase